ncbi:hypothetical protein ILYODFUR_032617, partial [Ilyodon furcidens]
MEKRPAQTLTLCFFEALGWRLNTNATRGFGSAPGGDWSREAQQTALRMTVLLGDTQDKWAESSALKHDMDFHFGRMKA